MNQGAGAILPLFICVLNTGMPYKGKFRPSNPSKYDGDSTGIIYRSSLELRFMQHLDSSVGVIKWQSEELFIPYRDASRDNTWHRYFPDFVVTVKQGAGTLTQMIEVKPLKQTMPPKVPTKRTRRSLNEQLTWVQNNCKWQAATEYCLDRGWKFKFITEKDLGML